MNLEQSKGAQAGARFETLTDSQISRRPGMRSETLRDRLLGTALVHLSTDRLWARCSAFSHMLLARVP